MGPDIASEGRTALLDNNSGSAAGKKQKAVVCGPKFSLPLGWTLIGWVSDDFNPATSHIRWWKGLHLRTNWNLQTLKGTMKRGLSKKT